MSDTKTMKRTPIRLYRSQEMECSSSRILLRHIPLQPVEKDSFLLSFIKKSNIVCTKV
jgi:hypothetical protein